MDCGVWNPQASLSAAHEWWDYNVKLFNQQAMQASVTYGQAKLTLGLMVAISLALGCAAAVTIARSITAPLARAVALTATVPQMSVSFPPVSQRRWPTRSWD